MTKRIKGWIKGKSMVMSNILVFISPLTALQSVHTIKSGNQIREEISKLA